MTSANEPGAYVASEDSAALRASLKRYSGGACLEIGAGNGGNLKELSGRFDLAVGTDLIRPRATDWSDAGADYVIADAASCFRPGVFELVAFNPPYVPSEGTTDRAVDGGRGGVEVALRFVYQAIGVLKDGGRVLFLLSSDNPLEWFGHECEKRGLRVREVLSRRLFYESLHVFEASKDDRNRP